jgi:esterase/lipase superfamily enzyme
LVALVALALAVAPAGCGGRQLVATPNLLTRIDADRYYAGCPAVAQAAEMEVVYATDRDAVETAAGKSYGHGRSKRVAFGTATVTLDPYPSWKELVHDSGLPTRKQNYALKGDGCKEMGRFDPLWDKLRIGDGGIRLASEAEDGLRQEREHFHRLLGHRLAQTPHKDVYVFIHGVNNTFEDAIFRAAEVWHFMGRVGVPVAYTWPAGLGGLRGYAYDRESGEFTVYHLKQFLLTVAACPDVERVHLIAHSRGSDVTISALRELNIAYQAQGKSTQEELKLENLVLAAPDLDEDVFVQRFVTENLLRAAKRTTIYTSRRDKAIELADVIFASKRRLGSLGPRDFSPRVRQALARLPNLQFIECRVTHFSTSHDYVFAHPAALSDLILVLRDRRPPGAENGRPLLQPVEGVWELHNDYLLPETAATTP